jgi:hypothetical protein
MFEDALSNEFDVHGRYILVWEISPLKDTRGVKSSIVVAITSLVFFQLDVKNQQIEPSTCFHPRNKHPVELVT